MTWDLRLLSLAQAHSHAALTWTMLVFTAIGSGWALLLLVPFLVRPSTRPRAARLLAAVVVTATLVFITKHAVRRPRPCASVASVHAIAGDAPTDPSFPSGHAAGSATVAAFV